MFREYGLEGPGVRGFAKRPPPLGAGLLYLPGPTLFEKPDGVTEPGREGVGARPGVFRIGDSGRGMEGMEGRVLPLVCGLGARAPGPIDCANRGMDGLSWAKFGFSVVDRLKLLL